MCYVRACRLRDLIAAREWDVLISPETRQPATETDTILTNWEQHC